MQDVRHGAAPPNLPVNGSAGASQPGTGTHASSVPGLVNVQTTNQVDDFARAMALQAAQKVSADLKGALAPHLWPVVLEYIASELTESQSERVPID